MARMFDNIAHSYDFLNHFFSLGIDVLWRKRAMRMLKSQALSNPRTRCTWWTWPREPLILPLKRCGLAFQT